MRRLVWLVVPAVFGVYMLTRAPAVGLIDSGELAAGCFLLNVLHPTGYPLYTMLGRLATLVPLWDVFGRMAVLSAATAAAGVGLFLWFCLRMKLAPVASGATALLLGLSLPVWSVAVDVEVYALTLVLGAAVLLSAESADRGRGPLLFAYLCGLALTNHLSAVSLVAGAGLFVLLGRWPDARPRLPVLGLLFLLGLSPYLFLVLRAQAGPLLAWGNTVSLERLWWHVTGKQYQVWMFKSTFAEVLANAARGAVLLCRSLGFVLVPVAAAGAAVLWRRRRHLCIGLLVTALLAFAYAVNYSIPDIEAYHLPALLALATLCAAGLDWLGRRIRRWQQLFWLPAVAVLFFNLPGATRRGDYVAYDQAMNTLASADSNAVVLTDWWDLYAPVFYLQHVEGVRPDVCIIDKELVRRSWYLRYLENDYPWLAERSRPELGRYRLYLDEFEHGRLRDTAGIQTAFVALLRSFLLRSPERPVYTTFVAGTNEDARQVLSGLHLVPVGLLFELRPDSSLPAFDFSRLTVRVPRRRIDG
ncbi:DUF2723 domain-containing protein, partial [candidate division WOR-3 bacterium]|nr:DUF2723 domain-containing protein [candidate division WOR-3 bacterium]